LNQELTPHISQLDTIQNEEAKPFFYSLAEDNSKDDPNYEVTRSYENGKIQHIRLKKGVALKVGIFIIKSVDRGINAAAE
jgi:hypothetical protein